MAQIKIEKIRPFSLWRFQKFLKSKEMNIHSKYSTIKVNGQQILSIQSTIQTTMAGNNKILEDSRKFECSVCSKTYASKGPLSKHMDKFMKDQKNKEITSQTTEETNKMMKL